MPSTITETDNSGAAACVHANSCRCIPIVGYVAISTQPICNHHLPPLTPHPTPTFQVFRDSWSNELIKNTWILSVRLKKNGNRLTFGQRHHRCVLLCLYPSVHHHHCVLLCFCPPVQHHRCILLCFCPSVLHHRCILLCFCPSLQRADIGLGGMTITYDREQYVDFTKPYLTLGITILYRKPIPKPPDLFSFLSPLSVEVS